MAGLQEAAAVVGILELSFRSICTLYDFLKELKEVPQQIERLLSEVTALKNILAALEYLQRADLRTQAIIARFDTPAALGNCAHSCAILQSDIRKWTRSGHHSLRAKVQVRWHKKSIEARVSHIAETKQTTLLSIAALQLALHIPGAMGDQRRTVPFDFDENGERINAPDESSDRSIVVSSNSNGPAPDRSGRARGDPAPAPERAGRASDDSVPATDNTEHPQANPTPGSFQAINIRQNQWNVKAKGQGVIGVDQNRLIPSRDVIEQQKWDVEADRGSSYVVGIKR